MCIRTNTYFGELEFVYRHYYCPSRKLRKCLPYYRHKILYRVIICNNKYVCSSLTFSLYVQYMYMNIIIIQLFTFLFPFYHFIYWQILFYLYFRFERSKLHRSNNEVGVFMYECVCFFFFISYISIHDFYFRSKTASSFFYCPYRVMENILYHLIREYNFLK